MGEGKPGSPATGAPDSRTGGEALVGEDLTVRIGNELAEIGLTEDAPWVSSMVLYGSGGVIVLALSLISPESVTGFVQGLAGAALLMAAFSAWGYRQKRYIGWATPVRVLTGMAIITAGGLSSGSISASLGTILIFPQISAAFLYATRRSVPYMVIGTLLLFLILILGRFGSWYVAQSIVTPAVICTLVCAVILSQARLRRLIKHHLERSLADPLTGLANTRHLNERLAAELGRAEQIGEALALFAIDLDNFKRVNDEINHRTGDDVLVAVGRVLGSASPEGVLVARRGGDEFSVLLPAADRHDLEALSQEFRAAIVGARRRICPSITPSGSVGYVLSEPGDDPEGIIERADRALHAHKVQFHAGRPDHGRRAESGNVADIAQRRQIAGKPEPEKQQATSGILRAIGQRWFIVAAVSLELAILVPLVSVIGDTGSLGLVEAGLVGLGFLTLAAIMTQSSRLRLGIWSLHAAFLAMGLLIAASVLLAGAAGAALLDMFMLVAVMGFFVFTPRVAAIWFVLGFGGMAAAAVHGGFANTATRLGAALAASAVLASMFAKLRKLTVKYMERHVELAQIDPLTGLANRRLLQARLADRLETAHDHGEEVVVIAVDLNDFKRVNDDHSHTMGDRLLCDVAEAIRASTRPEDLVARRGGDEFYIVCDDASRDTAELAGHRIEEAIERARIALCPRIDPTATVMIVSSEPGDDASALMFRADVALHAGKVRSHAARGHWLDNAG
ncbi:MAG: GGDEF domain-containing protein [Actinobacteria bacterium]|nr:GGDEF domain-containing protein [Actinomycetota bacterium]